MWLLNCWPRALTTYVTVQKTETSIVAASVAVSSFDLRLSGHLDRGSKLLHTFFSCKLCHKNANEFSLLQFERLPLSFRHFVDPFSFLLINSRTNTLLLLSSLLESSFLVSLHLSKWSISISPLHNHLNCNYQHQHAQNEIEKFKYRAFEIFNDSLSNISRLFSI